MFEHNMHFIVIVSFKLKLLYYTNIYYVKHYLLGVKLFWFKLCFFLQIKYVLILQNSVLKSVFAEVTMVTKLKLQTLFTPAHIETECIVIIMSVCLSVC